MSGDGWFVCALMAFVVAVFGGLIYLGVIEGREWEAFTAEHECKVVAHVRGEVFNTVGVDSKGAVSIGVGSTSDKTGWLCNDGVTYFR